MGLGLAIVRRIGALLAVDLKLESSPGNGTTFQFDLPIASLAIMDEPSDTQELTKDLGRGVAVWAVDDDEDVSEALKIQFESWGCDISLALSWEELEILHREQGRWPDLVLVDDMLGEEESGLEIANRLKKEIDQSRIVLVTGNTQPARLKEIRECGFSVLLKPTQTDQLRRLVLAVQTS